MTCMGHSHTQKNMITVLSRSMRTCSRMDSITMINVLIQYKEQVGVSIIKKKIDLKMNDLEFINSSYDFVLFDERLISYHGFSL